MATAKKAPKAQARQPSAMTGAEIAIAAAILGGVSKSAADVGVKGTEALIAYLRKEGPMAHRVLASWKEGKDYCIAIEFLNTTLHGGYVEKVETVKPARNFDIKLARPKRAEKPMNLGDEKEAVEANSARRPLKWVKQDDLLPLYVAPAGTAVVLLQLKDDVAGTLAKTPVATLSYDFSIIGGSDAQTAPHKKPKQAEVRLRDKGPFYLDD
jgi:hypothetical protein